jgi:methionine-rich copper-binding protein CopC
MWPIFRRIVAIPQEQRRDLLSLHGMAHTVINGAPLTEPAADETLTEIAASLSFTFDDAIEPLRGVVRLLDQIADLAPD